MNKLDIINGNIKYSFAIEDYKFILCSNLDKYRIKQVFRKMFSKSKSEERKENGDNKVILYNDKNIDVKRSLYFEVDSNFSIIDDCKLTTKSLILKYLEAKLNDFQYLDTINTINILFESLSDEINESDKLNVLFNGMNYKSLSKLASVYYFSDTQKDEFDLSYEELILFQLDMLEYISFKNTEFEYIYVVLDLEVLSLEILRKIKNMKKCYILIFVSDYHKYMENKLFLMNRISIDLENIEDFYNVFYRISSKILSVQEVENKMREIIEKEYVHKEIDVVDKLIKTT